MDSLSLILFNIALESVLRDLPDYVMNEIELSITRGQVKLVTNVKNIYKKYLEYYPITIP